ncbi:MAG: cyclase family protein [Methanobrevibacter arboriphilus]|uniref:Cyclase family protein n=1 Tax=Methanobrevibacter arboriphilus TaxID=39441 RepID=A0A843ADE4_METAZ|nr:cyclase family protein [Methanobrevibacter arboriphilus]MBF4467811.1 cyclase family protein [Methanobrevibacter arboriphilus]
MNYKHIDLSHEMKDNMIVYPGDPEFILKDVAKDSDYSLFKISGSLHTGTHIDAPYHYIKNGKKVNELNLNTLTGKASVLKTKDDVFDRGIKIEDIEPYKNKELEEIKSMKNIESRDHLEKIIILRTGWYKHWGEEDYFLKNPYISKQLAKFLIENKICGIAIDSCSVDKTGENKIHKKLLKNNIWIVENLTKTDKLVKEKYDSYFIPLNISSEASYIRAFVKN